MTRNVNLTLYLICAIRTTFRRLDGTWPGRLKSIIQRFKECYIDDKRLKDPSERQTRVVQRISEEHTRKGTEEVNVGSETELTSFLMGLDTLSLMRDFHVVLRFKAACMEPRNVDGKVAWTTTRTEVDASCRRIRLAYRTKEGSSLREEFVPLASLEPCLPNLRDDCAVVLGGELKGAVIYPSHSCKGEQGSRSGIYCKMCKSDKKKEALLFGKGSITRIRALALGPPSQ